MIFDLIKFFDWFLSILGKLCQFTYIVFLVNIFILEFISIFFLIFLVPISQPSLEVVFESLLGYLEMIFQWFDSVLHFNSLIVIYSINLFLLFDLFNIQIFNLDKFFLILSGVHYVFNEVRLSLMLNFRFYVSYFLSCSFKSLG